MKILGALVLVMVLAVFAYADIGDKMDVLVAESEQREGAITARAKLQTIYWDLQTVNADLTEIANSGSFNTIDTEIKSALQAGWNIIKDAKNAIEANQNLIDLLNWRK